MAKVLFSVKEFFSCDLQRQISDTNKKSELLGLKNMFAGFSRNEFYDDERLKACDEDHRRKSLESLCLEYQTFRNDSLSEEEFSSRQNDIWNILDSHYRELSDEDDSDALKAWKLCLARMDRRRMEIEVQKVDQGVEIQFNPELEPELKQYSETSQQNMLEKFKYTNLKIWSEYKLKFDDGYKKYVQYEKSPISALTESKEIIAQLNTYSKSGYISDDAESFYLLNHSTPLYVCATLIKHHKNELDDADTEFCKEYIIDSLKVLFSSDYSYQIGDGIDACIFILPDLLTTFPENSADIKLILLIALFNDYPIDMFGGSRFYELAINAIQSLWKTNPKDAESLLLGCLALRHRYFELIRVIREENYEKGVIDSGSNDLLPRFMDENKSTIELMISNGLDRMIVGDIRVLELSDKQIALRLIPNYSNALSQELFSEIVESTAGYLLTDDRDDKPDFEDRLEFLKKFSYFVLNSPKTEIQKLLQPFLDSFNSSEGTSELLEQFVLAQDHSAKYDNFWHVWGLFQPLVVKLIKDGYVNYRKEKIVKAFLFSQNWKESAKDWHTFRPKNKSFFRKMSIELAPCNSTLYSIAKLLNDIGSNYITEGVSWLANILRNNQGIADSDLETNTIYYVSTYIKRYMYENRAAVKQSVDLKEDLLIVLNFLIHKGEVSGYLLRESVV